MYWQLEALSTQQQHQYKSQEVKLSLSYFQTKQKHQTEYKSLKYRRKKFLVFTMIDILQNNLQQFSIIYKYCQNLMGACGGINSKNGTGLKTEEPTKKSTQNEPNDQVQSLQSREIILLASKKEFYNKFQDGSIEDLPQRLPEKLKKKVAIN